MQTRTKQIQAEEHIDEGCGTKFKVLNIGHQKQLFQKLLQQQLEVNYQTTER